METPALKDPAISPSKKILENVLGKTYPVYEELMNIAEGSAFELTPKWNYYNDGKAWFCKVQYKNKTVFWLSVWDKYFKIAFYFTEKNAKGIYELNIDNKIKKDFAEHKPVGRLLPLVITVNKKQPIKDILKLAEYKMNLK